MTRILADLARAEAELDAHRSLLATLQQHIETETYETPTGHWLALALGPTSSARARIPITAEQAALFDAIKEAT